ncbi:DEAD/DEAH box helicase [Nocardioides jishulii]|uniref:DEAD/DEAH box helicase n=1 Tax=Nocardioides jishulii TaxID=2575440 RepID=A0A4V5TL22_9ACTN|nr:DEAD/DEAH box helicase [Nocardioides jishulii]QCX26747.1 DEAD/DEAH box helicase [Nocardioides jishulii]TKI60283.1 DEAD/DEAH box helicase [Nocardioides jishulii]
MSGQNKTASRGGNRGGRRARKTRHLDNEGIIPILARAVREIENEAQRGKVSPHARTRFQVVALLVREERARIKEDAEATEATKAEQFKRLDGVATILAKTAARDTTLLMLLDEGAEISEAARTMKRKMVEAAGLEFVDESEPDQPTVDVPGRERRVVPQSVVSRQLANPFQRPDFESAARRIEPKTHRLSTWELIGPLLRAFEIGNGSPAVLDMPEPTSLTTRDGQQMMLHQAKLVASVQAGHRTFLLADEPGLGKTAQALLAAQAADAFPMLCVVPNVVKTNWAREAQRWVPRHTATVIHGDGHDINGFADIVIVNYEVLDRHVGWLGDLGFKSMVVDEAHFIKNRKSQRSQHVLEIADRIRQRTVRPLMMALTGTPLINDIEDFTSIWQFLGWIDEKKPLPELMARLEETGFTPEDKAFYPAARRAVIEMGIVRRRKVDVAADIPARRIADIPVELDDEAGRSIRAAERELARRLVERYDRVMSARAPENQSSGIDDELVRRVAEWERDETSDDNSGENVFTMIRRIGTAKAPLAADYAAQLARSVGKVVVFAKHVDVMDTCEKVFADRGIGYASIRGNQTPSVREKNIDAFVNDPDVEVVVCSLTAAGVGLNLQVSSNVVLAELSWTDAEQTQAIDRVHRIGQDMPVTAWRIIAAQTIDTRIAELIDSKAGLAARALDGSEEEVTASADIQIEAMVALLTGALAQRQR